MNHPRGFGGGSLTQLQVDTLTGASHADPATFRQAPNPAATATDTKLFSHDFDAFEVMNGVAASRAVLNDWMTFLSKGWVKTATGVSDTHNTWSVVGGYGRTWVKLGVDAPGDFTPAALRHGAQGAPRGARLGALRHALGAQGGFVGAPRRARRWASATPCRSRPGRSRSS